MLCESKGRIGFLGASFFIGVIVATTIIPVGYLSDKIGRKITFLFTIFLLIVSQTGFLFANSLDQLYVFMFILGLSFPGRIIVSQNYSYEFCTPSQREHI